MAKGLTDEEKADKAKELVEQAMAFIAQLDDDTDPLTEFIRSDLESIASDISSLTFDSDGGLIPSEEVWYTDDDSDELLDPDEDDEDDDEEEDDDDDNFASY